MMKKTRAKDIDITIDEFLHDVVCVMVDEVHMAKADALRTLLTGPMSHVPIRWGLTGTVPKEDYEFMSLKCSLGDVIGRLSANELQQEGVLANCHVNVVQLVDHVEYKDYQSELRYLLETEDRMQYIANLIKEIKQSGNTLILVDRIAPGKRLTELIPDAVLFQEELKQMIEKNPMTKWPQWMIELLLLLMVLPLLVLIFLGFSIWCLWSLVRVLYGLFKVLVEALERLRIKILCKFGI